jgi:cold shock CspA family protein
VSGIRQGTIITLQKEKRYGFIKPVEEDSKNIFFHFNNLVCGQDLSSLAIGDKAEYFEEDTPKGIQAYEVVITFHVDFTE